MPQAVEKSFKRRAGVLIAHLRVDKSRNLDTARFMAANSQSPAARKIKIGTQMEESVFRNLKMASARERRPVADLIQEAVAEYLARPAAGSAGNGLARLLNAPSFRVTGRQFRESMEADYWDQ
jgi:hypothetical protein